jgi:hypothetical protein
MYNGEYDKVFYKTLPYWIRYLAVASLLAFLPFFLSAFWAHAELSRLAFIGAPFGMIGFGVASLATTIVGVRLGFLPAKAHVSTADNPFQFWLTIAVMTFFSVGLFIAGVALIVALDIH